MSKILVINNGFNIGGIQYSSISSANYFATKGYDVVIAALYKTSHEIALDERIKCYEPSFNRGNKFSYIIQLAKYLRLIVRNENPDVIIANGEWTNSFVFCALGKYRIPIFFQDHMNPNNIRKANCFRLILNKYAYKRAKGVIALSNYSKEVIEQQFGCKNVAVIPNPVRTISLIDGIEEKSVICVGRMSREKGHKYLVEAFNQIQDPTWRLDLVGDGPESDMIKKIADGNNRIYFHGFQKDITPFLSKAKIFVLPSLSECFPLALIEAMSVGKACVATDCMSGKNTIIKDGVNGLLVQPGDANALADAINRLIKEEELRIKFGLSARQIKQELSADKLYSQYLNFVGLGK